MTKVKPVVAAEAAPEKDVAPAAVTTVKQIRASQRQFTTELPCGVFHDGTAHRIVTLRTLNAADRRAFGDKKNRNKPAAAITKLLADKIVEIEGVPAVTENTVRKMLAFDRDHLVFALRKETTKSKPFYETFKCAGEGCGAKNEVEVEVEEAEGKFRTMADKDRLSIENGMCVFTVEMPAYGFTAKVRYSDGFLQEHVSAQMQEDINPYDFEMELLSQLVLDFNGEGQLSLEDYLGQNGQDPIDIEFLEELQDEIRKHSYGFELNPVAKCYKCGHDNRIRVEALDFLLGGSSRRKQETSTP